MSIGLGPHTDLPSLETPPGFQFFHCIENSCIGGASQMTDGLAVARYIEEHDPDAYDALTTLRWVFHGRGSEVDWRWSGPLIDLGVPGSPITLRTFYPVRTFPDMAADDIPRAYRAVKVLGQLSRHPRFQITYKLAPGDIAVFDNRRVQARPGAVRNRHRSPLVPRLLRQQRRHLLQAPSSEPPGPRTRAGPRMSGVFITCAITGSGDTTSKSDLVPITPQQIAEAAIAAAACWCGHRSHPCPQPRDR